LRLVEGRKIAPGAGYGLEINVPGPSSGVTIYGHGGAPGHLAGMFFMCDTEPQLVTSFIVSGEHSGTDFGADLSLVLQPARHD
jgi:hypothetical protein